VAERSAEIINHRTFFLRPPGAIAEDQFIKACQKECEDCVKACPHHVILKVHDPISGAHRTAYIDLKVGGCEYCKDFPCITACTHDALTPENKIMGKADLLASCLTKQHQICDICRYACPEGYQALVRDMYGRLQVDLDICVGCGKCVNACFMVPKAVEVFSLAKMKNRKNSSRMLPT